MSDTVSSHIINEHLTYESGYFSEFTHSNFGNGHSVSQGTSSESYNSPYGSFSITETWNYANNSNHYMDNYTYTLKEGGNIFTYRDHYSRSASGGYNMVGTSTINGQMGPTYHYNSHMT